MGYMRHHAIIVTSRSPYIHQAHEKAASIFPSVSPVLESEVNGYDSFFIPPDGSKEAWPESYDGDIRRTSFVVWLDQQRYEDGSTPFNWVVVQYGDDEGMTRIVCDSDEVFRTHSRAPTDEDRTSDKRA